MITLFEASEAIGQLVVYRAPHVPATQAGEEGVITSVNGSYVFVRYGVANNSQATPPSCLEFVARIQVEERESASQYLCDAWPLSKQVTHHLTTFQRTDPDGTKTNEQRCRYCHKTAKQILELETSHAR